ncbi:MAG: TetR/AcrR family transcriptional regulator [Microcella sp.]
MRPDDVVDAALAGGLTHLTLTGVAERLGVGTATVYRSVPGIDDLRTRVLSRLIAEAPWPTKSGGWQLYLEQLGLAVAHVLTAHPGVAEFCESVAFENPDLLRRFGEAAETLETEGFSMRDAIIVVDLIMHMSFDTMRSAASPPPSLSDAEQRLSRGHALSHHLPPSVARHAIAVAEGWRSDEALRHKLRIAIAGVQQVYGDALRGG